MTEVASVVSTEIPAFYTSVRAATEALAAPLSAEDQQVQSMLFTSPTKWHLAHTTWFFEIFVLSRFAAGYRAFDPDYQYLFNSYYETIGERHPRPERGLLTRPPLSEIQRYRAHVDAAITCLLAGGTGDAALSLIELGCHHEQQHQELILTDIKHALSCNRLAPAYAPRQGTGPGRAHPLDWIRVDGGLHEIGHCGDGFCFDNEQPRHRVWIDGFRIASRPITSREWLEFMADGGYATPTLWLSDGWQTVQSEAWSAPLYWREGSDGWREFTLGGRRPLDPEAPVCHVSYYEADAFARWAGQRLPTEAEWEIAARSESIAGNLLDAGVLHPQAATGHQFYGDVWEWTQSPYTPYPGFRPAAGALGEYNGKFMANQMVLRGGSCATPRSHLRAEHRNFFPPSARWQFSGVRLAADN